MILGFDTATAWTTVAVLAGAGDEVVHEAAQGPGPDGRPVSRRSPGRSPGWGRMPRMSVTGIPQDGGAPVRAGVPEHGRVPKYYAVRGWDSEGRPTSETKARLGL